MKLRNKKTGEIGVINLKIYGDDAEYVYDTIETLCKEWEDNIPKEPLIKDEKIRKAVRAWAEAVGIQSCNYRNGSFYTAFYDMSVDEAKLAIDVRNGHHTITELCGEEEK